jgi:hypothetical protein
MPASNFEPAAEPPRTPSMLSSAAPGRGMTNNVTGRIVQEIDEEIAFIEPKSSPVSTALILAQKKMKSVSQRKFEWIEQDPRSWILDVADATLTAGVTTINVATGQGTRLGAGDTARITETGEVVRVTSISTDALTVVRGIGNSGSGTAVTGPTTLVRLAHAGEEGAEIGTLKSVQETIPYNYLQKIRTAYGMTWEQMSSSLHGGSDPSVQKKTQLIEHKKEIDRMIMFGKRDLGTGAESQEITYSGGFEYFISTNRWNLGNQVPTELQFIDWLSYAMQYGPNGNREGNGSKIAICSPNWVTLFSKFGLDKTSYTADLGEEFGEGPIGIKVTVYQSSHGDLVIMKHPMLTGPFRGKMFVIDPGLVKLCYHQGGNGAPDGRTKLLEGRGSNGRTAESLEYYSNVGLEFKVEMAHASADNLGPIV